MKFEGKEMEIRPLDSLDTRKETQDMSDLEFIGYVDFFSELYEKIDDIENEVDRYKSVDRLQDIAQKVFSDNQKISKDFFDSVFKNKDLREKIFDHLKQVDNRQLEIFLKLKEQIPELRESFKKDMYVFLESLGESYDLEKVDYLIDNIDIRFYSYDFEKMSKTTAFYNSLHFVGFHLMPSFDNFLEFKRAFYHEFLHVLSHEYENIISYKNKNNNEFNRGGQYSGVKFGGLNIQKFEWLNEAVTESLSLKLNNTENSKSYIKERKLLDLLNQKKKSGTELDFDLVLKTYFRHLKKENPDGKSTIDEWKEFSKEVDNSFGPGFLVKLDLFIEKNSIDKVLEIITSWPDGEPHVEDLNLGITDRN